MKILNIINVMFQTIALLAIVTMLASCGPASTSIKSSGIPSGFPSGGIPSGGTPSPFPGSIPTPSSGGIPGTQSPSPAPFPGDSDRTASGKQDRGSQGSADTNSNADSRGAKNNKSDDQILADALEELDRISRSEQQNTGTENGRQQTSGTNSASRQPQNNAGKERIGSRTDSEKTRDFNQELEKQFARFDDLILAEKRNQTKRNNQDGSGKYDIASRNQDTPLQTAMLDNNSGSGNSSPVSKSENTIQSTSEPPADIGDAQDDDIIARQIREAAMKEQDPELREKIWDEYRRYKRGN